MRSWHAVLDRPRQANVGRTRGSRLPIITVIMAVIMNIMTMMMPTTMS